MAKPPLTPAQLKARHERALWKFVYARHSFETTRKTISMFKRLGKPDAEEMRYVFFSSAIVTYCMPFITSETLGRLPAKFSEFADSRMRETHHGLLEARNCIYAHVDSTVNHYEVVMDFHYQPPKGIEYACEFTTIILPEIALDELDRLCEFQIERVVLATHETMIAILPPDSVRRMLKAEQSDRTQVAVPWPDKPKRHLFATSHR